jgi:hypothetical protein
MWPGKSDDLRKHGAKVFPFDGASDNEAHTIEERLNKLVAQMMNATKQAQVRAFPVGLDDMSTAASTSDFIRWMIKGNYVERWDEEMELAANMLVEKGLVVTYGGWNIEKKSVKRRIRLSRIAEMDKNFGLLISDPDSETEAAVMVHELFPQVPKRKVRGIIRALRNTGEAEVPMIVESKNCPSIETLGPDVDLMFPIDTRDPQRAPYFFLRIPMTGQEILGKVLTDGWDPKWAKHVIENLRDTKPSRSVDTSHLTENETPEKNKELAEVIYCYQRLVDPIDNAEGIYLTVFHQDFAGTDVVSGHAKHELVDGMVDYPVVVTRLFEDTKRLYDGRGLASLLRGLQDQVKGERDQRADRNSLGTIPPIFHPISSPPPEWGPAMRVGYRRKGEFEWGPTPPPPTGSIELENTLSDLADRLCGLDESMHGQALLQFIVGKMLSHVQKVVRVCLDNFKLFGPEELVFRVTGSPDVNRLSRESLADKYDIMISYDVMMQDPEKQMNKLNSMVQLLQFDANRRIDPDFLVTAIAQAIDPVLADHAIKPAGENAAKFQQDVLDDLTKIAAGIEMNARPSGAEAAIQIIDQYVQQPDVNQKVMADEGWAARLTKYRQQYQHQLVQMKNAQTGRLGTPPAQMGSIQPQQTL